MRVSHHALTDVGVKRSHNQDAMGIALAPNRQLWRERGHLFIVADGMGAHAVGELASKIAVDTIQHTYLKLRDQDPAAALRQAILEANQTIHEKGMRNQEFRGMGTTATALVILSEGAWVGHVGDSRCYRIRGPAIEQLSFDHSLQWELARRKNVAPGQVPDVPSHIIVRSLGPDGDVKVDVEGPYPIEDGDRFLLCSDGLSGLVGDAEIGAAVCHLPGREACQFLVDLANLRGGIDNISVILVQTEGSAKPPPAPVPPPATGSLVRRWLARVPISYGLFLAGVTLGALGAETLHWGLPGSGVLMTAAAVFCATGVGVIVYRRRRRRQAAAAPPPPPPIHRTQPCTVEPRMIEDLARIENNLWELAQEEAWGIDGSELEARRHAARAALETGRLDEAFCLSAHTLSELAAAVRARRDKHEAIKPRWRADSG